MFIFRIDDFSVEIFSLNIICSPSINEPVVSESANSFWPVVFASSARKPIAPLDNPLTLVPATLLDAFVNELTFNIVNVWISYRCKSNCVEAPV